MNKKITGIYFKIATILLFGISFSMCSDSGHYMPYNYKIFKDTPVWELAKAVRDNDTKRIEQLVNEGVDINYKEPYYGYTILTCAMLNCDNFLNIREIKLSTIRTMLELGADPNIYGDEYGQRGENAVLNACYKNFVEGLQLLLEYGGDPNSRYCQDDGRYFNDDTALIVSIRTSGRKDGDVRILKMLIDAGADVNKTTKLFPGGALDAASYKYKTLMYLFNKGLNPYVKIKRFNVAEPISILEALRYHKYPLDSEEYRDKLKVIEFLKTKGLDYYATPIPPSVMEWIKEHYPDNWQEYASKY